MLQKSIFLFGFLFRIIYGYSQVTTITDLTLTTATNDGVINSSEYAGYSIGINSGFGDVIGKNSAFYIDSDESGNLNMALKGGGSPINDFIIIYIDAIAGGYPSTVKLTDNTGSIDNAISAVNLPITFASGFEADYAIGIYNSQASLVKLNGADHILIKTLLLKLTTAPGFELSSFNLSDMGLTPGSSFDYIITYLNPSYYTRSDEFHGVSGSTIPPGNITGSINLGSGDFNTFISVNPFVTTVVPNSFSDKLIIYPNPTLGNLFITFFDNYHTLDLEVRNMSGQLVQVKKFNNSNSFFINLEGKKGLYFLIIKNELDQKAIVKVIKE